jgi:hypothetical protein
MKVSKGTGAMAVALCLATSQTALADSYPPSHSCRKPSKPYQFTSEWEVQSFNDDVARYKRCIQDFVDEQNQAVENHRQAASNAIDDWNRFVKYDLQ